MNTPESDLERAAKHNPSWIEIWKHSEPKLAPGLQVEAIDCPHARTPYRDVPGYVSGYGCPVCKGVGPAHVKVVAINPELLREAYNEAWNAGAQAGRIEGMREAAREGGDEGFNRL